MKKLQEQIEKMLIFMSRNLTYSIEYGILYLNNHKDNRFARVYSSTLDEEKYVFVLYRESEECDYDTVCNFSCEEDQLIQNLILTIKALD
jgi:hypothetical protein